MIMSTKTLAFVPVRGGSRELPGKNIRLFCGRPLVYWSLVALEEAHHVDRVVVATDCDQIAETVLGFGFAKTQVYRRSAASATDTASTETVMLEFLDFEAIPDDVVFLLVQATSPFTRPHDFDAAITWFQKSGADSVVSCAPLRRFLWSRDGKPLNYDPRQRPRRQEFEGCLMENGAFYISRAGSVRSARNRLSGKVVPYAMAEHTALELDAEHDWVAGEALMTGTRPNPVAPPDGTIKLFLTDVDGVLTDGGMYYGEGGDELKRFNTLDGKAFELLREAGVATGIVTAEDTRIVADRARKIRADHVYQGVRDKLGAVEDLCRQEGLTLAEVAYVGDDLGDLELLRAAGFSACPADAVAAVRQVAHYRCKRRGGKGCVREVADFLRQNGALASRRVLADGARTSSDRS